MQIRHEVGIDRLMWGQDYPYAEGSLPFSRTAYQLLFGGVPEEEIGRFCRRQLPRSITSTWRLLGTLAEQVGPTLADLRARITEYPANPEQTVSRVFAGSEALNALLR